MDLFLMRRRSNGSVRWLVNPLRDPLSAPQRLDLSVLWRRTPQSVSAEIVHQIPRKPLLHNGVSYDPEDIVRFNGQPLLYALDERFGDSILIVDEPQTISTLLSAQVYSALGDRPGQSGHGIGHAGDPAIAPGGEPALGANKSQSSPDPRLFSNSGWGGSRLDVRAGTQWADTDEGLDLLPLRRLERRDQLDVPDVVDEPIQRAHQLRAKLPDPSEAFVLRGLRRLRLGRSGLVRGELRITVKLLGSRQTVVSARSAATVRPPISRRLVAAAVKTVFARRRPT